jgi:hypothetical protein
VAPTKACIPTLMAVIGGLRRILLLAIIDTANPKGKKR